MPVLAAFVAFAWLPSWALGEHANLMPDPGFEAGSRGWSAQGGKIALIHDARQAHTGRNALRVEPAQDGKQWVGRLYCSNRVDVAPGGRLQLSAWVKGKGQATLGVYEYSIQDRVPKYRQRVAMASSQPLTADWQPIRFVYRPTDERVVSGAFYVQVAGEGGHMLVDDVAVTACPEPYAELTLVRVPAMAPAGAPLAVSLAFQGQVTAPEVRLSLRSDEGDVLASQTARLTGASLQPISLPLRSGTDGCSLLSAVEKTSGAFTMGRVDICPSETYRACAAAAASVRLKTPAHLVFVGDSLTALFRGHNYVDKVRWWLQDRLGEAPQVTNAGVGGDTITRVKERLERDVLGLAPKPTHVFIFLGHNDSKLKSTSEYREAVVPPADFEKDYREVVQAIQKRLGAHVIVLSATSSVYEITKATAAEASRRGRTHNLFGKPEALEQFNGIARKVAADLGAGYLDLYEPFRTHPEKATLFTADGVHINERGNRLVTLEILRYLSR